MGQLGSIKRPACYVSAGPITRGPFYISMNRPSTRALFVFLIDDGSRRRRKLLGAVARTYARPIEIVMRANFLFRFSCQRRLRIRAVSYRTRMCATGRRHRRSEVGWPFHFSRGNDSEDVDLFVSGMPLLRHSSRLTNGPEDRLPSSFIAYQPGLIQRMSDLVSLT